MIVLVDLALTFLLFCYSNMVYLVVDIYEVTLTSCLLNLWTFSKVGLLLDRPEFQQHVQTYYVHRGQTEHWMQLGPFQRPELPQALGSHLAGKDRCEPFALSGDCWS